MQSIGVLKNGGLKAAYASGLQEDKHLRPRFIGSRARHLQSHGLFVSLATAHRRLKTPRKGRAERVGVVAARSLTRRERRARHARRLSHRCTVVFTPALRTRMDFAACCMSQGWPLSPASPRSCELSPGHVLGRPPVMPASVPSRHERHPRPVRVRDPNPRLAGSGIRSGHRIPPRI